MFLFYLLVSVSFLCCLGLLPVVCVLFVLFGSITCCVCPFCIVWVHYLLSLSFLCCLGLLHVVCVIFVLFGSITYCLCVSFLCCLGPLPVLVWSHASILPDTPAIEQTATRKVQHHLSVVLWLWHKHLHMIRIVLLN